MKQNTLYGMEKYGWIKDDQMPQGRRKYHASTPQALITFILDCGYSTEIGKGRQAAITSTVMLYEAIRMLVHTSYKGVLVTDDIEFTGKNIFNDKLKGAYRYLVQFNPWLKPPKVPSYAEKKIIFDWSEGVTKDEARAVSSEYSLAASDDTQTINGTTPSKLVIDEAQNVSTYQAIKLEARPTMLSAGLDGVMRVKRQICGYGTGSSHQKGRGSFESEYKATIHSWINGKDTSSFVPLFLDWTCRPFMTLSRYLTERKYYLNTEKEEMKGMSKEERTSMFHAAMPSSPEDMFLTNHKTMVPPMVIRGQAERISTLMRMGGGPERGRFRPIYNRNVTMPYGMYVQWQITGVEWVPADPDDITAPVLMLLPPEKMWTARYYQGTDPIQSSSGSSRFASVIWDEVGVVKEINGQKIYHPMPVCILNDRQDRVEESYLQSKLMGMYYANLGQKACMEVTERNQGQDYEAFVRTQMGLAESLWLRAALPKDYKGGKHTYGIDLKQGRKGFALYYDTVRLLMDHHQNIWFNEIWWQVGNVDVEERPDGSMDWGIVNKNMQNDDLVIALSYAHISSRADGRDPRFIDAQTQEFKKKQVRQRDPRTNQLYWIEKKVPVIYR